MFYAALCDINSKSDVLTIHDLCHSFKCKNQKIHAFTRCQFQLGGAGYKSTVKNFFVGNDKVWFNFIKHRLKIGSPTIATGLQRKVKTLMQVKLLQRV